MYVLYRALTSPPQREWKHQRILDISQRLQLRNAAPPNFRAACHCLGPPVVLTFTIFASLMGLPRCRLFENPSAMRFLPPGESSRP